MTETMCNQHNQHRKLQNLIELHQQQEQLIEFHKQSIEISVLKK